MIETTMNENAHRFTTGMLLKPTAIVPLELVTIEGVNCLWFRSGIFQVVTERTDNQWATVKDKHGDLFAIPEPEFESDADRAEFFRRLNEHFGNRGEA